MRAERIDGRRNALGESLPGGLIVAARADLGAAAAIAAVLVGARPASLAPRPLRFEQEEGRAAGKAAVGAAAFVALVVSEAALADRWVRFAAEAARIAGVPLIPVPCEPVEAGPLLRVTGGAEPVSEAPFDPARDGAALLARIEAVARRPEPEPEPAVETPQPAPAAAMVEIGGVAVAPATAGAAEDRYQSPSESGFDGPEEAEEEKPVAAPLKRRRAEPEAAGAVPASAPVFAESVFSEPAPADSAPVESAPAGAAMAAASEASLREAPEAPLKETPAPAPAPLEPEAPAAPPPAAESLPAETLPVAESLPAPRPQPVEVLDPEPGRLRRIAERFRAAHLFENAPRRMRMHRVEEITVRLSRDKTAGDGMAGEVSRHDLLAASAMTVVLDDPTFSYAIHPRTPATQWVDRQALADLGLSADRPAEWRWAVAPLKTGIRPLHIRASARIVDGAGGEAEEALPDQVIEVKVGVDPRQTLGQAVRWTLFGFGAGVIGHYAEVIVEASRALAGLQ